MPDYFLPEAQPVVCQLDVLELYDPQVDFSQGGEGEALQVDGSGAAEVILGGLADRAGELDAADTTDPFRFQGYGAGNLRVTAEFCTVPCDRVSGNDQGVVLLIPGIKARCTPWPLFADGGYAEQVMTTENRSYPFVKCYSFHLYMSILNPASASTLSITVITRSFIVSGRL